MAPRCPATHAPSAFPYRTEHESGQPSSRPCAKPAVKASPDPTVSTTSTAYAGSYATSPDLETAKAPRGPRVTTTCESRVLPISATGNPQSGSALQPVQGSDHRRLVVVQLQHVGAVDRRPTFAGVQQSRRRFRSSRRSFPRNRSSRTARVRAEAGLRWASVPKQRQSASVTAASASADRLDVVVGDIRDDREHRRPRRVEAHRDRPRGMPGVALDARRDHAERQHGRDRLPAELVVADPADHGALVPDARDPAGEVEGRAAEHPARGQQVPEHFPEGDEAAGHAIV